MVIRKNYLKKLQMLRDKDVIKIITGSRRCGKSTLLMQMMDYLRGQGVKNEQIVFLGKVDNQEVDFVVEGREGKEYYQVCLSALDEVTYDREMGALEKIKDNYPKFLLTLDELNLSSEGIRHKNIVDFLLEDW